MSDYQPRQQLPPSTASPHSVGRGDSPFSQAALEGGALSSRNLCHHPEFKPHGSLQALHRQGQRPFRLGLHRQMAMPGHRSRASNTPDPQRQSPRAAADALRRGQPLLPRLREERQLQAPGAGLRPGNGLTPHLRALLSGARARSIPRIPDVWLIDSQPLHHVRALCASLVATFDGKDVFALAGRGTESAHRDQFADRSSSATARLRASTDARRASVCPVGAILAQAGRLRRSDRRAPVLRNSRSAVRSITWPRPHIAIVPVAEPRRR